MRALLLLTLPLLLATAPATPPNAKKKAAAPCPAARSEVKKGSACKTTPYEVCAFPDGSECSCRPTRCVTPAGPVPGCESKMQWVCRDDGCPMEARGACAKEGQACTYDDGMCASRVTCRGGTWRQGRANCRPSAPPPPPGPPQP